MTDQVPLTRSPRRVRLRVEDYLALDRAGAFDAYGRTELLDGDVHYVHSHHRPHARVLARLFLSLATVCERRDDGIEALMDASVEMPPHNVPQPDIVLTREPEGEGLIPLSSVALAVEVSDTSLRHDLGRKRRIYAREGVAEYWVADVRGRVIHQLWSPLGSAYRERRSVAFGDPVRAATLDGIAVETNAL